MSESVPVTLIRGRPLRGAPSRPDRKPPWLRVRPVGSPRYLKLKRLMKESNLNTVCEEANCPNIGECWNHGTATFMILGSICTRSCGYCNVTHGTPDNVDLEEPWRVGKAIATLGLNYVVITSVDRDDLPDGGASVFAATIKSIREKISNCRIEVLIPDFGGKTQNLQIILDAKPDIVNHNIETIERLYRTARPGGRYDRALALLKHAKHANPEIPIKSGIMVGLGETLSEIETTLSDLRYVGCDIVTIGQYLRPSPAHLPVTRYYTPDEFENFAFKARKLGFRHVESGPLVRSSYHAHEQSQALGSS